MGFWSFMTGKTYETPEECGEADGQHVVSSWEELGYSSEGDAAKWMAYATMTEEADSGVIHTNPEHRSYIRGFLNGLVVK